MTRPEATFIRRNQVGVMRERRAPTATIRATHQAAEPRKTPRVIVAAPARSPAVTPRPTNSAANDRMVIGFVRVGPSVEKIGAGQPTARGAGLRRGHARLCAERPPGQPQQEEPTDDAQRASAIDQNVGHGRQAERGDRPVGRIGGGHAQTGDEAYGPPLRQGASDAQQGDRTDRGRDRGSKDKAPEEQREIHLSSGQTR